MCVELCQWLIELERILILPYSSSLGSILLLIKKATNDPLHLWVITYQSVPGGRAHDGEAWIRMIEPQQAQCR